MKSVSKIKSVLRKLLEPIEEHEMGVAIYTGISLIAFMLIATTENIPLILVSVVNLWIAVKLLNKVEEKRLP